MYTDAEKTQPSPVPGESAHFPDLQQLFGLEGKLAVVSGGASGIGLAVSCLLSRIGMQVEILDRNRPPKSENSVFASRINSHLVDVTNRDQCREVAGLIAARYGKIATLVNAAGIVLPDSEEGPSSCLSAILDCNVLGTAHLCESFRDHFEPEKGTIVNVGSIVASMGWAGRSAYCASKGAVEAMSRALAIEYASLNIRVNVVAPGIVATPLMKTIIAGQEEPYLAYQQRALLQINGRMLRPEEVASTVLYLASDLSSGVVGATIDLSAGRLAGYAPPPDLKQPDLAREDSEWMKFSGQSQQSLQ